MQNSTHFTPQSNFLLLVHTNSLVKSPFLLHCDIAPAWVKLTSDDFMIDSVNPLKIDSETSLFACTTNPVLFSYVVASPQDSLPPRIER